MASVPNSNLPPQLVAMQREVEEYARGHGLDFYPTIFEYIDADQLNAISSRLSSSLGRDVRARSVVDPSILGGVVVRVGDKLVDGSIRTRLKRLRKELEGVR